MKKVLGIFVISLITLCSGEYVNKVTSYDVMENVDSPITTQRTNNVIYKKSKLDYSQTVYVRALGDVDSYDLEYAADVIVNFYGYNVEIYSQVEIENGMTTFDGNIHSVRAFNYLPHNYKTVYVTDKLIYTENNVLLRGVASNLNTVIVRGNRSFMKETIIHEIGHTLGLRHCDDLTCIMAIHNDEYDSGDFCDVCKTKINF